MITTLLCRTSEENTFFTFVEVTTFQTEAYQRTLEGVFTAAVTTKISCTQKLFIEAGVDTQNRQPEI